MFRAGTVVCVSNTYTVGSVRPGTHGIVVGYRPTEAFPYHVRFPNWYRTLAFSYDELEPVDPETASVFHLAHS